MSLAVPRKIKEGFVKLSLIETEYLHYANKKNIVVLLRYKCPICKEKTVNKYYAGKINHKDADCVICYNNRKCTNACSKCHVPVCYECKLFLCFNK